VGYTDPTPLIAGLAGGAERPMASSIPALLAALEFGNTALTNAKTNAPTSAVVAVLRESIPAGFDQYTGYDLVLYVNLTNIALAGPQTGRDRGERPLVFRSGIGIRRPLGLHYHRRPPRQRHLRHPRLRPTPPDGGTYVNAGLRGSFTNI